MKYLPKFLFLVVSFFLTFDLSYGIFRVFADDDHFKKRHRHRGGSHKVADNHTRYHDGHLKSVTNQTYRETCGECHFAYQPELLPSASWIKILNQPGEHFGKEIEIDSERLKIISNYLTTNAAENSTAKQAVNIMRSLGQKVSGAITQIPYIRKKHRKISPSVFDRKSIGTLSNCTACHRQAEQGVYEDDDVKIPE